MKALVSALALAVWLAPAPILAQESKQEITAEAAKAEKKAIVANNIDFTEAEAKVFWPLYAEYQKELDKVYEKDLAMIQEYASEYGSLTDAQAKRLLDEYFEVETLYLGFRKSYLPKFEAVLPGTKVMRYYQIENKIHAIIEFELAAKIPLAE